jgi:hypothetical protein
MFGRKLLTGLELHARLSVKGLGFEFLFDVFYLGCKPKAVD